MEDAYLAGFADIAPAAELREQLALAEYVQGVARLCSWQRALADASREEAPSGSPSSPAVDSLIRDTPR